MTPKSNQYLYWSGAGIYEPTVVVYAENNHCTTWRRNTDGNPFVGVRFEKMRQARRFAKVAKQSRWGWRFED